MYEFKHIVIDGWNAIHANPRLKSILLTQSQDAARSELAKLLAPIHDFGGARITIVYDGVGEEISIVRPSQILTFSEVFTPSSLTADELIEQLCSTSKRPDSILVVTRDNLLRLTASSFGALSVSPDKIFEWSSGSSSGIKNATETNNRKSERDWKKSNPFMELDSLAADIGEAVKRSELVSKHLKKRARRAAILAAKKNPTELFQSKDKNEGAESNSFPIQKSSAKKTVSIHIKSTPSKSAASKTFNDLKNIPDDILPKTSMFARAKAKYYFGERGASGKGLAPKKNRRNAKK